jgi:hypothetical protein
MRLLVFARARCWYLATADLATGREREPRCQRARSWTRLRSGTCRVRLHAARWRCSRLRSYFFVVRGADAPNVVRIAIGAVKSQEALDPGGKRLIR